MTPVASSDRLWPVLLALVALLTGAIAVELGLRDREGAARVVAIGDGADGRVTEDDGDGEAGGEGGAGELVEAGAPLDADHERARQLAHRGETSAALPLFERAVASHPEATRVRGELGYWRLAAGDVRGAREVLTRARELGPEDPWIALNLAAACARDGDLALAETEYRRALTLKPGYLSAQIGLGIVLRRRGAVGEAIALLEAAVKTGGNESRARALVALGRAYLAAARRDDAARSFDKAIEYAPAAVEIRVGTARGWMASGSREDLELAASVLARAVEMAPDVPQVHATLGRVRERRDDASGAEAAYERALRLDPAYRYARRRLLRLALDREDFPRARLHADYLLRDGAEVPEHHFLAGLVAARSGRRADARRHYADAIARAGGTYPEAYFNLGLLEKAAGDLEASIAAYEQALAQRPGYLAAMNNLSQAYEAARRPGDAERVLRAALATDPGYAPAWLNLGELLDDTGRRDAAIEAFDRAIAARPGYPKARLARGETLRRAGKKDEAIASLRLLVIDEPRFASAWVSLADALADADDLAGAVEAYRNALAVDADHVGALRRLAEVEARLGHRREAIRAYEELLDHAPADAEGRLAIARMRREDGDSSGCARDVRVVLAQHPSDAVAKALYDECTVRP